MTDREKDGERARAMRFQTNKASIRVLFPDGCRFAAVTLTEAAVARDAEKFGLWLIEQGEAIIERATSEGMCAKKEPANVHD